MILGSLLIAVYAPHANSADEAPLWAVLAFPASLFSGMHALAWLAVTTDSTFLFTASILLGLGVPFFSIVAYSVSVYRALFWLSARTPWPKAASVVAFGTWVVAIVAPLVWVLGEVA